MTCRNCKPFFFILKLTLVIILQTDKSGCATQTVSMTEFALNKIMYVDSFDVNAEMEEYGTGMLTERQILME